MKKFIGTHKLLLVAMLAMLFLLTLLTGCTERGRAGYRDGDK